LLYQQCQQERTTLPRQRKGFPDERPTVIAGESGTENHGVIGDERLALTPAIGSILG
jgi:hypothetical protein